MAVALTAAMVRVAAMTPRRLDMTPMVVPLPSPVPRAAPRPTPGPRPLPSMQELAAIGRAVAAEPTLAAAARRIQRELCRILGAREALVVVIDWAHLEISTLQGTITSEPTRQLVAEVAGSGRRAVLGDALLEPVGGPPARIVLAVRKPVATTFAATELAMAGVLAGGFAPVLDRLLAALPARPR